LGAVDRLRLEIIAIGRAKQCGAGADGRLDQPLRGIDFKGDALGRGNGRIEVGE
jgi:hypothetical protein